MYTIEVVYKRVLGLPRFSLKPPCVLLVQNNGLINNRDPVYLEKGLPLSQGSQVISFRD
jgi:hypothetical protein